MTEDLFYWQVGFLGYPKQDICQVILTKILFISMTYHQLYQTQ